jgi:DNA-binding NarL/FixJ family response regulator
MADTKAISILLVDDHSLVRSGLQMLIESQLGPKLRVIGEAGNASQAIEGAKRLQPDIILLDLDLGKEDGLALLPRLLDIAPESKIIVLTGLRDREAHFQAGRLGAMGLVLKENAKEVLIKAIEKVHRGESWFDRSLTGRVLSEIARKKQMNQVDPEATKIAALTEREREIIELIGQGLKNKIIAERLFISVTTVRHHLTSIYGKLEVADRLELIIYAYRHALARPPL